MSQEKTTLEVIAPTVDDAVQKGLSQLNLPQDAVEVEVLDAGSRGLFGLGSRQARIRLTIKPRPEMVAPAKTSTYPSAPVSRQPAKPPLVETQPAVDAAPATAEALEKRLGENYEITDWYFSKKDLGK